MRNRIFVTLIFVSLLTGCKFDNQLVVKNVLDAFNSGNPAPVEKYLSDDFILEQENEQIDAGTFLQLMDSLHGLGYRVTDSITSVSDSLIISVLTVSTPEDLSLDVQPLRKYEVKWLFSKKKLAAIRVAEDKENNAAYWRALKKARKPFEQWAEQKEPKTEAPKKTVKKTGEKPEVKAKADEEKLLDEYSNLSDEEKEEVKVRAALSGVFFCSKCFFEKIVFKDEKTVTIYDAILGIAAPSTYTVKGKLVTIKKDKDKKEFVFELVNYEKLIGKTKGATGEYIKLRESD